MMDCTGCRWDKDGDVIVTQIISSGISDVRDLANTLMHKLGKTGEPFQILFDLDGNVLLIKIRNGPTSNQKESSMGQPADPIEVVEKKTETPVTPMGEEGCDGKCSECPKAPEVPVSEDKTNPEQAK